MEIQTIWEERPNFNTAPLWYNNTTGAGLGTITNNTAGNKDVTWRHVAERYRFFLQYGDPKTVRAVIGFEADSQDWGEARTSGTVTGGKMGAYTSDTVQLEIKHAYLDFMVPNTPVKVTAGIQPFVYGGRLLINNDGAGVTVTTNFAPHTLSAAWVRFNDNNRYTYGVRAGYILDWKMVQKAFDVNVYGAYVNDLWSGQQATLTEPWLPNAIPIVNQYNQYLWYAGASAGFRPGNWTFFLHGLYVGGKRDFSNGSISDTDIMAYAAEAMVRYQIGPGMAALVEGFYASGNDSNSDNIHYFPTAQDSEARSIFGNDRTVFFWMNAGQIGYYHNQQIDFSGMWYGRGAFEYSPTAWLRMILNWLYIGDTSQGGTGTTFYKFAGANGPKIVNSPKGSRQDKDENYVGQEINLITTVNIYKNFVYNIGLYYFIAGDVWDRPDKSAKDSYGINTKLNYAF
jgi:hypothetical protein